MSKNITCINSQYCTALVHRATTHWLGHHFSTFVRMRTRSLVPKPKTTVIGTMLGQAFPVQ